MNPPSALQNAMGRERKPFTYTPGGLDLSQIKSERMAQRLLRNAMNPGVPERPVNTVQSPTTPTTPIAVPNFNALPVQVFPAFSLPANPKSLLRTRSNPVQSREQFQSRESFPEKVAPSYQFNNNVSSSHHNQGSGQEAMTFGPRVNSNNVASRPASMYSTMPSNNNNTQENSYEDFQNSALPTPSYDANYYQTAPKDFTVVESTPKREFASEYDTFKPEYASTQYGANVGYGLGENKPNLGYTPFENTTKSGFSSVTFTPKIEAVRETPKIDYSVDENTSQSNNGSEEYTPRLFDYYSTEERIPQINVTSNNQDNLNKLDNTLENDNYSNVPKQEDIIQQPSSQQNQYGEEIISAQPSNGRDDNQTNSANLGQISIEPLSNTISETITQVTQSSEETEEVEDNDQVVKKVKKENTSEVSNNQSENGDDGSEAALTVKLPSKKSAAKTETKIEVLTKTLPDGSIEETKKTITKTTVDGKTSITTKTEIKIIPTEEDDEEVEEEEEEVEEEEDEVEEIKQNGEEKAEEPSTTIVIKQAPKLVNNGQTETIVKQQESSETTTTRKVVVISNEKEEEEDKEQKIEVKEAQTEVKEVKQASIKKQESKEETPVVNQEEAEEEVEEQEEPVEIKKVEVKQSVEETEQQNNKVEEVKSNVENNKKLEAEPQKENVVEEEINKEVKVTEVKKQEETKIQEDEESEYTEEEIESEPEEAPKQVPEAKEPLKEVSPEEIPPKAEPPQQEAPKEESPKEEPKEVKQEQVPEPEKVAQTQAPPREIPILLEKVEDVEIKPIGPASETISKTRTESTEIITNKDTAGGPISTQTELHRVENVVVSNRVTKTLDHSYEQLTQQGLPTVKTYFAPNRERVSISPSKAYTPSFNPEPATERRHSLLLERLSMERQMPQYQNSYQSYNNQSYESQTAYSQEPQSEVVIASNVKPSKITNQQWFQQRDENAIYNNTTNEATAVAWPPQSQIQQQPQIQTQPQYQPQAQTQYQAPPQPQYQPQAQPQYKPQAQPQYQPQPQPQYQPTSQPQPQPQYQPTSQPQQIYTDYSNTTSNSLYQQNSLPSYTPKPTSWGSSNVDSVPSINVSNQYSYNTDSTTSYQKSTQQYSSSYVPPPWEQDSSYVPPANTTQTYYQPTTPTSDFKPSSTPGWSPSIGIAPPGSKFSKPAPTATSYVPPAPNQSFVKPVTVSEPPKVPGRKTYYSEYERRYISVPESTYIPGESKFQPQPDPSPQYYYDNDESTEKVEPTWRKELREFTEKSTQNQYQTETVQQSSVQQSSVQQSSVQQSSVQQSSVQPPWENNSQYGKTPTVIYTPTPSWSQTLRPGSGRERSFESDYVSQDYQQKTQTLGRNRPLSYIQPSESPLPDRPRGVSVDRYNPNCYHSPIPSEHSPVPTKILTPGTAPKHNYHNPNVPAYHSSRASAEPREQAALYQQPRQQVDSRASPVQSRSFKYLQWITGTEH